MKCPSCKNKEKVRVLERLGKYEIFHCPACDLFFSSSPELPQRDWYEKTLIDEVAMGCPQVWHKWREDIYGQFLERKNVGKTLLDVGCGDGEFIRRAKKKGHEVIGIDLNRVLISNIKKKLDLQVYALDLERFTANFPSKRFDIITFFEVLEHQNDPDRFLALVKKKLKPKGNIALSVPNRERFRLGKKRFPEWDAPPHHFTWWNTRSLKKFLTLRDFRIKEFKEFKRMLKVKIRPKDKNMEVEGPYLYLLAESLK